MGGILMTRPNYRPAKSTYGYPSSYTSTMDECPNDCDLYLLRDAAADERGAIANYLGCALETCLEEVFFDVVEDEMRHYLETMKLISLLDPIQAKMLEEADLDFLVMKRVPSSNTKWGKPNVTTEKQDAKVLPPTKKDLPAIRCLTQAIQDELHAINKYQKYMNQAENQRVKDHFCKLMNEEKEHVAEFTAALFELTHEPLS